MHAPPSSIVLQFLEHSVCKLGREVHKPTLWLGCLKLSRDTLSLINFKLHLHDQHSEDWNFMHRFSVRSFWPDGKVATARSKFLRFEIPAAGLNNARGLRTPKLMQSLRFSRPLC